MSVITKTGSIISEPKHPYRVFLYIGVMTPDIAGNYIMVIHIGDLIHEATKSSRPVEKKWRYQAKHTPEVMGLHENYVMHFQIPDEHLKVIKQKASSGRKITILKEIFHFA